MATSGAADPVVAFPPAATSGLPVPQPFHKRPRPFISTHLYRARTSEASFLSSPQNDSTPVFPRASPRLWKTPPSRNPLSMRFRLFSTHTVQLSLQVLHIYLCVPRKTPPQTLAFVLLFQTLVFLPARFWKLRTNRSPSIHADSSLLSTLPPTTTTTTRNIYPFTLFLRSILPPPKSSSPTPHTHHHAKQLVVRAGPHKMHPEIHSLALSHEPPRTP